MESKAITARPSPMLVRLVEAIAAVAPALADRARIVEGIEQLGDESPMSSAPESLVVEAHSPGEVQTAVSLAARHGVPVVPRGGRTGLVGGAVPVVPSLVIDVSGIRSVRELDISGRYAHLGPGVTIAEIGEMLAPHGMLYPPDPASIARATIGGTVATNAGGLRCVKYGVTERWIRTLDVVLADGRLVTLGHRVVKDATGFDLTHLIIGSEGTLGVIVGIGITFCRAPTDARLTLAAFGSADAAVALASDTLDALTPSMCEMLDAGALAARDTAPIVPLIGRPSEWGDDPTLLMIEVDGSAVDAEHTALLELLEDAGARVHTVAPQDLETVLAVRRGGSAVRSAGAPQTAEALVEASGSVPALPQDVSVPLSRLAEAVGRIRSIASGFERTGSRIAAHLGDGNLHVLLVADPAPANRDEALARLHAAMALIVDAVLELGGTASGEHGIGALKRPFAALDLGADVVEMHRSIKLALDPQSLMNPEKAF
ncbi:FAD-linked oxidase C-terminal domain-containing protein [Leucobacter sp. NPDC077196]|uniref:FAD-binding oxidoreductase n=1 Tax=Leucobacter sp. NPDC077196 TaxID=3154959 RepID=UPI0034470295